jgi:2-succinyl-5-enolpyruvyl-6-hydroxy-3-cyclohexene-1-carboxylate synthase
MTNIERARQVIAQARALGVTDFCVCAGSRNAPLLAVLACSSVRLFSFVDERSAAFFALGRAKVLGCPVAVVTTSGTAAAELLPATIEAYYSGVPLLLITADRPARYRGTGAPQAIEQERLFGCYASTEPGSWPLHINVEFDEPLIDGPPCGAGFQPAPPSPQSAGWKPAPHVSKNPLIILAGLAECDRESAKRFVEKLQAPIYAEPLSGLRNHPLAITAGERMLTRGNFDQVIRIGNVPTLRFWRDLDEKLQHLPVVSISALPFKGLARGEVLPMSVLDDDVEPHPAPQSFFDDDRAQAQRISEILDDEPQSELAMIRKLSQQLDDDSRVYLGNSLPIREWDLVATREKQFVHEANRGANGIDGQLSTFFGQCDPARPNVCVIGDLTAIYDLGAPWIVPQLERDLRFRIVIINNGGGRIFSRVASLNALDAAMRERIIENAHSFHFDAWAAMWNIRVTELCPDAEASRRVWAAYDSLW